MSAAQVLPLGLPASYRLLRRRVSIYCKTADKELAFMHDIAALRCPVHQLAAILANIISASSRTRHELHTLIPRRTGGTCRIKHMPPRLVTMAPGLQ